MTEISQPWGGIVTGDSGPYSNDEWSDMFRRLFQLDRTLEGVLKGQDNELAVTGVASPVSVATGHALVDGKYYKSDAIEQITIPTPAGSTRVDVIVLRKDFSAQTVRLVRVAGVEGAGVPAITQTDGTTWDVALAQVSITTGGTITVTDVRVFGSSPLAHFMTNDVDFNENQAHFDVQVLTDQANIAWDMDAGPIAVVTLGGNRTLDNPTNVKAGASYILIVKQDGTGTRTLAYGANFLWPSGVTPVVSAGASEVDIISFIAEDASTLYGAIQQNFS